MVFILNKQIYVNLDLEVPYCENSTKGDWIMSVFDFLRKFFNKIGKIFLLALVGMLVFVTVYAIVAVLTALQLSYPSSLSSQFWTMDTVGYYLVPFWVFYCAIFNKLLVLMVVGAIVIPMIWNLLPFTLTEKIKKFCRVLF